MKAPILDVIGETELNRSAKLHEALAANDRIKYYLSVLQLALARADHPEQALNGLRPERIAHGIPDRTVDNLLVHSRRENGHYRLPGVREIMQQIVDDLRVVAAPVLAETNGLQTGFAKRMEDVLAGIPKTEEDLVHGSSISELARTDANRGDSIHRLLVDLHKALNVMQAALSEEHLDGAYVYHIEEEDRPAIAAFMAGLNRTAPLKFNHPGLGTTATRSGNQLIIQNDLGTTDAHVIVIHVEGMQVEITHTDVHPQRIRFLQSMLQRYPIAWGEEQSRQANSPVADGFFHLITGRFDAKDAAAVLDYLQFLGSRLVFLIDWNRARKELRGFLRGKDRIALLAWAADEEVGHRGFLDLGGAQIINRAIEQCAGSVMHFGDQLYEVLGDEVAMDFIRFVFRTAGEGLRDHQSPGLIQDRIRAELQAHFSSEGRHLFKLASEQAAMIFEIAALVQEGVYSVEFGDQDERYKRLARRARSLEHSADELVGAGRDAIRKRPEYTPVFRLLERADDAADELEEVAFLLALLAASQPGGEALEELGTLAGLLVQAAQEWVKVLNYASRIEQAGVMGAHDDVRDFLTAIDALFALEHRADEAERSLTYAAVQRAHDYRQLHIYSKMGDSLEEASDALKWAGLMARDYLLGNVLTA